MNTLRLDFIYISILFLAVAGCTQKNTSKRPNILFAISDDQSFANTSFTGKKWVNTPGFDRVAQTGIYFKNCYAGSPGCAPSRSSIVTGRYHWQNEQSGQHASAWLPKFVPFVDLLDSNGYVTGMTGKGVSPFRYGKPFRIENAAGKGWQNIQYKENSADDERYADGIRNLNYFANFRQFMQVRDPEKPFFFWYGASEPHRGFEKGSWKRRGKSLDEVDVPAFLPDTEEIRGDLLDYAVEIEWFDLHLQRMINYLREAGELENTIIIVTSDNGMAFPRAKANVYEYGVHVPLAISFPEKFPGGRMVEDPVSFIDLAPTILELTNTSQEGMLPMTGRSITKILYSEKEGIVDETKNFVMAGRERHSSSRYNNLGYPQRVMRRDQYLYIWNMKPERWPAGAPRRLIPDSTENAVYPVYGIDESGEHHTEWAFTDIDGSPSKSFIIENYDHEEYSKHFQLAVAKRPEFELFDVVKDPFCLSDLAGNPEFTKVRSEMNRLMLHELKASNDPRVVGPEKEVFDMYKRYSHMREFPKPD